MWRGQHVQTIIPTRSNTVPRYACLYLRPFATRFRAAARMRAIARAMRPLGATVALHAGEARSPIGQVRIRERENTVGVVMLSAWNKLVMLIEWALGSIFTWEGVELVDTDNASWQSTFRELAFRSRWIVMDVSAPNDGLDYEAEFIADMDLADRLILLHNPSLAPHVNAEQHVDRLRSGRARIPIITYNTWRLRDLTKRLEQQARRY